MKEKKNKKNRKVGEDPEERNMIEIDKDKKKGGERLILPDTEVEKRKKKKKNEKKKKKGSERFDFGDTVENNAEGNQKKKKERIERQDFVDGFEGNAKKKQKKNHHKGENFVIADERFSSAQWDPRFQRVPQKQSKVPIDERFSRMFTDERFVGTDAPVDKWGRPKKKRTNPMLHYYISEQKLEPEAAVESEKGIGDEGQGEESSQSGSEKELSEDEDFGLVASISDASTTSTTDEDDFDDEASINSDIAHYLMASHEDTPTTDHETHRLAVVNMDWDHIKAVDLYVVMSSCLPKGGQILSVSIYPSEFGIKCMEAEATHGPSVLFDNTDDHSGDESEVANEKLRTYELNRLRYYHGVVVCDSSATANHLYKTLDGTELLKTSNVFDLRFIPDSMEFKHPPRDVATEAPSTYKEPNFETRALQHSTVKLTWEEDEPERRKVLRRKFNPDQMDELKEYLATSTDDDDDDDDDGGKEKKQLGREKLLALLESADGSDGDNSDDKDMEITFNTGLEDLSKRILEKKDKRSETIWEQVLRKRKEKRAARKKRSKYSSDDDSSDYDNVEKGHNPDEPDDFFVDDTAEMEEQDEKVQQKSKKDASKKRDKGKRKGKDQSPDLSKEQEASRAELELLFADDQGDDQGPKGYNIKPKKVKGKKGKKDEPDEEKLPNFDVSSDPRFASLFTSHLYALDPTDPQYKRSAAYARQRLQKQKPGSSTIVETIETPEKPPTEGEDNLLPASTSMKETYELSSTIRSLKRNLGSLKK